MNFSTICLLWINIVVLALCASFSMSIPTEEFFTLTPSQKIALEEFRERIIYRVPHDYMSQDIYLLRWLRDRKFNVDQAEERLINHIEWREENNMDSIFEEDWSDFNHEYKMSIQGCNKYGHPIILSTSGDWDIRRAVVTGKSQRMMRFMDRLFEETLRMQRRMVEDGKNTTQLVMILDNLNTNLVQHTCARCIAIYLYWLTSLDLHYPGVLHQAVAVNTPGFVLPIWDLYKNLVPSQYIEVLSIFGRDKKEWSRFLLKEIDPNQLSVAYGGTNPEAVDLHEFRETGKTYKCTNME